jgi:hypothetical protein
VERVPRGCNLQVNGAVDVVNDAKADVHRALGGHWQYAHLMEEVTRMQKVLKAKAPKPDVGGGNHQVRFPSHVHNM